MFERFTKEARLVVTHAVEEAQTRGDSRVGTEHLLIGVARSPAVADVLPDIGIIRAELDRMDQDALVSVGLDPTLIEVAGTARRERGGHLPFTGGAKDILKGALRAALDLGHRHIGVEHVALALAAAEGPDRATAVLRGLGIDSTELRATLLRPDRQAS